MWPYECFVLLCFRLWHIFCPFMEFISMWFSFFCLSFIYFVSGWLSPMGQSLCWFLTIYHWVGHCDFNLNGLQHYYNYEAIQLIISANVVITHRSKTLLSKKDIIIHVLLYFVITKILCFLKKKSLKAINGIEESKMGLFLLLSLQIIVEITVFYILGPFSSVADRQLWISY